MSLSITVVGPHTGISGYDSMTRGFIGGLRALGASVRPVPVPGWSPPLASLMPPEPPARVRGDADVAVHLMMPDRCRPLPGPPNANFTMFEGTGVPASWIAGAAGFDRIILPTATCRDLWRSGGVDGRKLRVCGLGVDGERLSAPREPLPLSDRAGRPVISFRTRFLHIGEPRPRKNQLGLIRCWLRATRPDDDAILIVKLPGADALTSLFWADIEALQQRVGRRLESAAPVLFLPELMDEPRLRSLYHSATHYVTMSHGEGWDLPMIEAAAAGLSLVVPDQPTYRAYLEPGDADWIPCREVDAIPEGMAGADDFVYFRDLRWWTPDEGAMIARLMDIIAEGRRRPGPQQRIVRDFSWRAASRRLLVHLEELAGQGRADNSASSAHTTTG